MKPVSPLLVGVALLFWGFETDLLLLGALLGLAMEAPRVVRARLEVPEDELRQVWNLTAVFFLVAAVYAFASNDGVSAVQGFLDAKTFGERSNAMNRGSAAVQSLVQWLPLVFFPFMAAQVYSRHADVDLAVFSLWLRRKRVREAKGLEPATPRIPVVPGHYYLGVCLCASCVHQGAGPVFFIGFSVLVAWALWPRRNPRFSMVGWGLTMVLAIGLGYLGTRLLVGVQAAMEQLPSEWLARFVRRGADPLESRTALGQIGRIKLSGRIALRLQTAEDASPPSLLRESVYSTFRSPSWYGSTKTFASVFSEASENTWLLGKRPPGSEEHAVRVAMYLKAGQGLLPLPVGSYRIDDLPVVEVQTNHLGTARVKDGPGLVDYRVNFDPRLARDLLPQPEDMVVPKEEQPALTTVAAQLGLPAATLEESTRRVNAFFLDNFQYNLDLGEGHRVGTNETAIGRFVLHAKTGHCEYFASATTLLLRQIGIPARYVVGYSVQEKAGPGRFVVRDRHAHAWCKYYDAVAGGWRDLDTTPGTWFAAEEKLARFWQPLTDGLSRLWYEFQRMRYGRSGLRDYVLAGLGVVGVGFVGRLLWRWRKRGVRRGGADGKESQLQTERFGLDSEFFEVERALARAGLERRSGETPACWLERIRPNLVGDLAALGTLVRLHYRYRFDAAGLQSDERMALRAGCKRWLGQMGKPRVGLGKKN